MDKINRAPESDFAIESEDTTIGNGPAIPGQIINEATAIASGDNSIHDRQNPVVEKSLPIAIGQGRIVKEIQVDVKMSSQNY